jgi:quinol monooxygenase YgiN
VEHARLSYVTADPARLDDFLRFMEDKAQPQFAEEPGYRGMWVAADDEVGVAVVATFWVSGDAMRESERVEAPVRRDAVQVAEGTVSVEPYAVENFFRITGPGPDAALRLTRVEVAPEQVDAAVAGYEDTALPWLTEADGFCSALLFVHRRTGRGVTEVVWRDEAALAASRSAAASIRVDAVAATDAVVRALEEYRLVFTTALPD